MSGWLPDPSEVGTVRFVAHGAYAQHHTLRFSEPHTLLSLHVILHPVPFHQGRHFGAGRIAEPLRVARATIGKFMLRLGKRAAGLALTVSTRIVSARLPLTCLYE